MMVNWNDKSVEWLEGLTNGDNPETTYYTYVTKPLTTRNQYFTNIKEDIGTVWTREESFPKIFNFWGENDKFAICSRKLRVYGCNYSIFALGKI